MCLELLFSRNERGSAGAPKIQLEMADGVPLPMHAIQGDSQATHAADNPLADSDADVGVGTADAL